MENNIRNFTAQSGSTYGTIKLAWDIPDNWYAGGITLNNTYWGGEDLIFEDGPYSQSGQGWHSQLEQHPNINLAKLYDFNYDSQTYLMEARKTAYPNPLWLRRNPEMANQQLWHGGATYANMTYVPNALSGHFGSYNTNQLPTSQPGYWIQNSILEELDDDPQNRLYFPYQDDSYIGEVQIRRLRRPIPSEYIPNLDAQKEIGSDIPFAMSEGYVVITGLDWKINGRNTGYWHWSITPDQAAEGTFDGTTSSMYQVPEADESLDNPQWGAGINLNPLNVWVNKYFTNEYGTELETHLSHQFNKGGFVIIGRQGYAPHHDHNGAGSPTTHNGYEHPSELQLNKFIDPNIDSSNYFSFYHFPTDEEWNNQRCSLELPFNDGNWYFTILYTDGSAAYSRTGVAESGPNDTYHYSQGWCPYIVGTEGSNTNPYNFPIVGPCGDDTGTAEPYKNILLSDDEEKWEDFENYTPVLTWNRQSLHFTSETQVMAHHRTDLPFTDEYSQENSLEGSHVFMQHYAIYNGQKFKELYKLKFTAYGESSGYASGSPNTSDADFVYAMDLQPFVYCKWDNSYWHQWFRDRYRGKLLHEQISEITSGFDENGELLSLSWEDVVNLNSFNHYDWIWGYANNTASSVVWNIPTILKNKLNPGAASSFSWNQNDGDAMFPGLPSGELWTNDDTQLTEYIGDSEDSESLWEYGNNWNKRCEPFYLRLDNELWFPLHSMNVPENFIVRIINNNASGDYQNSSEETERPVWTDFTKDMLQTAPFWDYNATVTAPMGIKHSNYYDVPSWFTQATPGLFSLRKQFLKVRFPVDTTYEDDGPQSFTIIAGFINPEVEEIAYSQNGPCDEKGGSWGMPLILTNNYSPAINKSPYSNGLESETITCHYQNTAPVMELENVQDVNSDEMFGSRELIGTLNTHGVPAIWSNNYDYSGNSIWKTSSNEQQVFNQTSWDVTEEEDIWVVSNNNNAVAACLDLAGNLTMDHKHWNFHLQGPEATEHRRHENINKLWTFGEVFHLDDLNMANANPVYIVGKDNYQIPGGQQHTAYAFSSNEVMYYYLQNMGVGSYNDPLTAALDGWWSYEGMFNQTGWAWDYVLGKMRDGQTLTSIDTEIFYNLQKSHMQGFRVKNPYGAEVIESLDNALDWTPVYEHNMWPGALIDFTEIILKPYQNYNDSDNFNPYPVRILGDAFLAGQQHPESQLLDNGTFGLGTTSFEVDKGCITMGKFASWPFCFGSSSHYDIDWMHPGPTQIWFNYAQHLTLPAEMNACAYWTAFNGKYCDVNPGWDFPDWTQTPGADAERMSKKMYWYSPLLKRWDMEDLPMNDAEEPYDGKPISIFSGEKGETYVQQDNTDPVGATYNVFENEASDEYKNFTWISKKLTMRASSQQKMFYKIRAVVLEEDHEIKCFIRTDKDTSYTELGITDGITTDFKIPKRYRRGRWIQIKLENSGVTTIMPKLSSVTVIWRQKPIK